MASSETPVASTGLSPCCIGGFKHSGEAVGKIIDIGEWQAYISEPVTALSEPKKMIIFFSDIRGSLDINNKLIQDNFARCAILIGNSWTILLIYL